MKLHLKTAISILINMQDSLVQEFEFYNGTKGMPEEMCEAIEDLTELSEKLRELYQEIQS